MKNFPPPTLSTPRLVLRELRESDLEDVVRIAGNLDVSKWLEPVPHPYTHEDAEAFFQQVVQGNLGFIWAIVFESRFVGLVGVGPALGYWSCPSVWGQGLMTEAAKAAVSAYFKHTEADEIPSRYFEGNMGSARVLERIGFVKTDRARSFSLARNAEVDAQKMLLTRARWLALSGDPD